MQSVSSSDLNFAVFPGRRGMSAVQSCLLITVILVALFLPGAVYATPVPPGMDFFLTTAPTNVDLTGVLPGLGVVPLKGLPFPPDNPFFPVVLQTVVRVDWVDMHGNVVGPDSIHKVGTVVTTVVAGFDTVVQRTTGPSITGVGTTADLSIQMVWLSLMSISP